jgi:glutamine amidotransferase
MIAVVDYGMGNLRSVSKALESVGATVEVTGDRSRIESSSAVVLPGVGAFAMCMENLERAGLVGTIRSVIDSGRPFLGICVGMQILFEESREFGRVAGLGVLPGKVERFEPGSAGLKVPHMGWNRIKITRRPPHLAGIDDEARAYFVHSYYVDTADSDIIATTTDYGRTFVSSAWRGNLYATQFHPEKSQSVGLKLLENFASIASAGNGD